MAENHSTVTAYKMGTGHPVHDGKPLYSWPYDVYYVPSHPSGAFYLAEGDGRNGQGSFFSPAQILEGRWRGHLETAGASWLIPFLERMARREPVEQSEIFAAYKQVHKALPPVTQWKL